VTAARLSTWIALAILAAVSAAGSTSALDEVSSMSTLGQRLATATEFGYAITGLVAIVAVLTGQRWSRPALCYGPACLP
jgi:hypothetical protein